MPAQSSLAAQARWMAVCAYDGTAFAGWQSQAGGRGIQDVIEKRLAEIFAAEIRIYGSGRTDAGVHARRQVFHFDAAWRHSTDKLLAAFRIGLPPAIQIKSIRETRADFHARIDAVSKRYIYYLRQGAADPFNNNYEWSIFRPLDHRAMAQAASLLEGQHDFRAFTALNGTERENTIRHLRRLEVRRRGAALQVILEAEGFLYKMARSLVGALVSVGEGKITGSEVQEILRSQRRTPRILTAPAHGLFLDRVFYR